MKLYGLIGYPLGHSFSKKYFTEKFEREGLGDCCFELFELEQIAALLQLIQRQKNLKGLAVTIPYKEAVINLLTTLSPDAREIGAVNCIEFLPTGLKGHNTDVIGFIKSFVPDLQAHHKQALILGTGGASKAVQYALKQLNIPFLLVSRSGEGNGMIGYHQVNEALLQAYNIIINASPVGMYPHENEKPELPYQFISSKHYLYDLVYRPAQTVFLSEGLSRGATIKNGLEMLELQAEENWKIWNQI